MSAQQELIAIADQLAEMLPRFRKSQSGLYMGDGDEPTFTRITLEAKVIFDDELGRVNDFSMNIVRAANEGVSNFIGSPSYHSVQQVEAIIRAGVNQLNRRARRAGQQIPAADRYVTLADNERPRLVDDLHELKQAIIGSNEGDEEDRMVALSEIAAFEQTIIQPRVSTDLIQRFVDMVISWITRTFAKAAVGEAAKRLIVALSKLVA